jgi:uncharacterized protein YjbJ (UPF0337 family)
MKSSTKDKAERTLHELKGKVKEFADKLTDTPLSTYHSENNHCLKTTTL